MIDGCARAVIGGRRAKRGSSWSWNGSSATPSWRCCHPLWRPVCLFTVAAHTCVSVRVVHAFLGVSALDAGVGVLFHVARECWGE